MTDDAAALPQLAGLGGAQMYEDQAGGVISDDANSVTSSWEDDPTAALDIKMQLHQLQAMIFRKERECKDAEHKSRMVLVETRERLRFSEAERERLFNELSRARSNTQQPAPVDYTSYIQNATRSIRAEFEAQQDTRLNEVEALHAEKMQLEESKSSSLAQRLRTEQHSVEDLRRRLDEHAEDSRASNEAFKRRLAEETERANGLQQQLNEAKSHAASLDRKLADRDEECARNAARIQSLDAEVASLMQQLQRSSESGEQTNVHNTKLQDRIDATTRTLDAVRKEMLAAQDAAAEEARTLREAAADAVRAARASDAEYAREVERLHGKVTLLETELARKAAEEKALQAALELEREGVENVRKNFAKQMADERRSSAAQREAWQQELTAERESMTRLMNLEVARQRQELRQEYDLKVAQLEAEIERLQAEAQESKQNNAEVASFAAFEQQLQRANEEIDQLKQALAAAEDALDKERQTMEERFQQFCTQYAAENTPQTDVEKQLRDANLDLTEENMQLRARAADAARAAEQAEMAQCAAAERVEAALRTKDALIARLEAEAAENLQTHRAELAAKDVEYKALLAERAAQLETSGRLTQTEHYHALADRDAQIAALRVERDDLAEKNSALPAFEATIEELTSRMGGLLARVTELEAALRASEREVVEKDSIIRMQNDELATARGEIQMHNDMLSSKAHVAAAEEGRQAEVIALFEGELNIHQSKLEALQGTLRERQGELDTSMADIQEVRREAEAVRLENASLQQQVADAKAKWQGEVAEKVALQTQHARECDALRDAADAAARKNAGLERELAVHREHAESLKAVMSERDSLEVDTRRRERDAAANAARTDVRRLEDQLRTKTDQLLMKDRKEEALRHKLNTLLAAILPNDALEAEDPVKLAADQVRAWRGGQRFLEGLIKKYRAQSRRHRKRTARLNACVASLQATVKGLQRRDGSGSAGSTLVSPAVPRQPLVQAGAHGHAAAHATPPTIPRIPLPTKSAESPMASRELRPLPSPSPMSAAGVGGGLPPAHLLLPPATAGSTRIHPLPPPHATLTSPRPVTAGAPSGAVTWRSDTAEESLDPRGDTATAVAPAAGDPPSVDQIEAMLESIQECISQPLPGTESRAYSPARPGESAVLLNPDLERVAATAAAAGAAVGLLSPRYHPPPLAAAAAAPVLPGVLGPSVSPARPAGLVPVGTTSSADVAMAERLLDAHMTSRRRREDRARELQQLIGQLEGELNDLALKEAELQVHKERTVATIDAQHAALVSNHQFWKQQLARHEVGGAVGEATRCREKLRQTEDDLHALGAQRPELLAKAEQGHLTLTREILKLHEQKAALDAERRQLLAESDDLRGKEQLLRAVVAGTPPPASHLPPPIPPAVP